EIFDDFRIISSQQAQKIAPILSDFAICADCEAEFRDPKNRRYHHAFINCTHCGPRFSIISSLPYDRKNTSMAEFKMCASCEREYNDPLNRRFHAQPTCCPNCGPKAFLKDLKGQILASNESAFSTCAELLEQGKIIAIKGLGGFHLCCDGSNVKAINELRKRKNRPAKPLAIMCENEQMASALADFTNGEKKLLNSQLRPIVLAKKSQVLKPKLSQAIAPNIDKIGVFLAPTSFNLLLFHYFKKPIIATSANLSGEPIITSSHELCAKLNLMADFVLDHNRQILNPSDDSVVFYSESLELAQYIRTSRGLRPSIVPFEIPNNISPNSRIPSENSRIPNELFEKIKIIYEDDDILVISKPSGLVVHEASSLKGESTLVDFLKQSGRQLATLGGEFRAGIVHRLDRYTSGVMVVAKSDFASAELSSQLQQKTASRIYIALCDLPLKQNCVVERAIGRCENNRLKKAVYPLGKNGAKYAKSAFCNIFLDEVQNPQNSPKKNTPNIIAAKLFTGRTHQIRVHLSSINRHILGDVLYGFKGSCDIIRVFLHGYILELKHPRTGQMMSFCAPLEDDFAALIGVDTRTLNEKLTKNFVLSCFEPINQWLCLS
ncbi:MAG: Sua5/YciO/YrdC/YwlC family protein, partial [Campylobacter sp.]|nr:Sua5/YciO/YrdC/YwlC family protein [Campylobacter sp.]